MRQVESVMGRLGWVLRLMDAWTCMYSLLGDESALSEDSSGNDMVGLGIIVRRLSVILMSEGL